MSLPTHPHPPSVHQLYAPRPVSREAPEEGSSQGSQWKMEPATKTLLERIKLRREKVEKGFARVVDAEQERARYLYTLHSSYRG